MAATDSSSISLLHLPNELQLIILGHFNVQQLMRHRLLCRHFNSLIVAYADVLPQLDVSRLQLQGVPTTNTIDDQQSIIRMELNTVTAITIATRRTKRIALPNIVCGSVEKRTTLVGWLRHCRIRSVIIRKMNETCIDDTIIDWFVDEIEKSGCRRLQPTLIEIGHLNLVNVSTSRLRRLLTTICGDRLQKLDINNLNSIGGINDETLLLESINLSELTSLKIQSNRTSINVDVDNAIMQQLIRHKHIVDIELTQCSLSANIVCDMIEVSVMCASR